ncbi:MAG: DUF6044 family protein [Eubacteriales bacterium]|nr:DUF6044 family protein [Eubacteriales bacterium]
MKKFLDWLDRFWYWFVIGGCIGAQALVFLIFREESYLTVQDNLDLFIAHFQVMNHWDGWFAHNATMPMLGGISRDCLSSEWNLYNIFFTFLPPFWAYMVGYFLKILIGMGSFVLLAKDIYKESFAEYKGIAWVMGLCYGILPLFPAYGIAFASVPLAVLILRKIYFRQGKRWYAALFCYPLLSYFSYFGFFLLAYLVCAILILSVRDRKINGSLIAALFVLAAGYVCFEYRLFAQMLFSDVETIRVSMVDTDLDFAGVLGQIKEAFLTPVFHAASDHAVFVLPVCLAALVLRIAALIRKKEGKKIWKESLLWVLLFIVFNCIVNGLYFWGGFRRLFETLVPPLKGFQFNRTTFFNPFLWYAAFFLVLKCLYDKKKPLFWRGANLLACIAVAVILLTPAVYNEFYWTCYHQAYRAVKHTEVNLLNYREYYSADLMEEIKADIDYDGEYAAGYGLNPAVLEYSGIATLDGYLGFYPQSYKEEFTRLIQPSYDRVEEWRVYYGEWGARAYLYAGSGESIYNPYRNQPLSDLHLYIDADQFRKMGGTYLFSRYELENMEEMGFWLTGVYSGENSPYTIYLYQTES